MADTSTDLHQLVESTYHAHKRDIHDYAGGHLNPDKLVKLPVSDELGTHVPWKSSQGGERKENPFNKMTESRKNADFMLAKTLGLMENALLDFSVGTVGTLPPTKMKKKTTKKKVKSKSTPISLQSTKSEIKLESLVLSEIGKIMSQPDGPYFTTTAQKSSRKLNPQKQTYMPVTPRKKYILPVATRLQSALTEELKLPELMLPVVDESVRVPPSLKNLNRTAKQNVHNITNKKFVTTHLAGITRKDRFDKMLDFDRNVLHRYETMEKNVRDGHKAADHLEQKLIRRLLTLNNPSRQVNIPNFERLQTYDEVWQDLCLDSSIFGSALMQIKSEYDKYLSDLLDEMKEINHTELLKCLNSTNGVLDYDDIDIKMKQKTVENMEEEGRQGLLKNAELHDNIHRENVLIEKKKQQQEIEEEQNRRRLIPNKTLAKTVRATQFIRQPSANQEKNMERRLQDLRADVWERLDEIELKHDELKVDFVPKTLYRNLQYAVQDTENEMQKLMQQNEYLTKNMKIQEESIRSDLLRYDSLSKQSTKEIFSAIGILENESQ